jgi:ATP-dependent Lon protease
VEEIQADYLKGLTFHYVTKMKEVIEIALSKEKVKNPVIVELAIEKKNS